MSPKHLWLWRCVGLAGLCLLCADGRVGAGEAPGPKRRLKSDPLQEYCVYLPKDFDAQKRYWLFVAVHGLGGNGEGALGWADFADEGQCIVVGPTFGESRESRGKSRESRGTPYTTSFDMVSPAE